MPTSVTKIGEKLRAAREAAGLSTRVAAREAARRGLPLSHATLANYERGETMPTMGTISLLASIYECPEDHLLGTAPVLTGVRYRALKSVRVRDRRHFEGEATRWIYLCFELEDILQETLPTPRFRAEPEESGKALAARVRREMGLGDSPIPSVIRLLEDFGVRVVQVRSEARIDGMAAMFGESPVIALNPVESNDRFRFNAAHELGHHLYEDWRVADEGEHGGDDRAHDFASHLLMPDTVLEKALHGFSMVRLVRYKELFGISLAAMIYRGHGAGLISKSDYQRIWREFGRLGWRKREPGFVACDYSSRLEHLIESAVSGGRMSYRDVARLAAVDEGVVRSRVLEAIGGQVQRSPEPPSSISFMGRS